MDAGVPFGVDHVLGVGGDNDIFIVLDPVVELEDRFEVLGHVNGAVLAIGAVGKAEGG